MSQLNAKEALVKKPSANKSIPDVLNRKKLLAPRLLHKVAQQKKAKNSEYPYLDASPSNSKLPTKPTSASTAPVKTTISPSLRQPTTPTISTTPSKPQPTSTPTISTTLSMPQPTITPTVSTTPTTNNSETMPVTTTTTTTPPNSLPVNTSTTTPDDHVEETDAVETVSTRPDGRIVVIVYNKM